MLKLKTSTAARVPVRMVDALGDPVAAIPSASVTGTLYRADNTYAAVPMTSGAWHEATSGALASQGVYSMLIPAGVLEVDGFLVYAVSVTGSKTFHGTCQVGPDTPADTLALVGTVTSSLNSYLPGLAHSASFTFGIAQSASIIRQHHENKREIFTTGSEANREAMYEADGSTIYKKWDLADQNGVPNSSGQFYRKTPV